MNNKAIPCTLVYVTKCCIASIIARDEQQAAKSSRIITNISLTTNDRKTNNVVCA